MKLYSIIFRALAVILALGFPVNLPAQTNPAVIDYGNNKMAGSFLTINGVKLYYEVYGNGAPLVLIHGNGGNIGYMRPQIEFFSKNYKVIIMDCRGRGKSELGKDSLTYIQMTKDIADLLNYLHLDSTYIVGRSDGGIIALLMAIYYPDKVKKAVAFAANL
ncbi:MAG: alpha/beta fold hydrolase, partial [Syntrophothermus sp.]